MKLASAILVLLAFCRLSLPQTTVTGKATTGGVCSPATTGNGNTFNIKCVVGVEQGKKMIAILNEVLSNQIDPDLVMTKLDEIAKAPRRVCSGNSLTNCVAGDNFGPQTINGYVPPPSRLLKPETLGEASALLSRFPGATVRFIYIGSVNDQEISSFFDQVRSLFVRSGWQVAGAQQVGEMTSYNNGSISHGEGLGCSATNRASQAGRSAIKALGMTGVPCTHSADGVTNYQQRIPMPGLPSLPIPALTDLYISIGTRTLPPR